MRSRELVDGIILFDNGSIWSELSLKWLNGSRNGSGYLFIKPEGSKPIYIHKQVALAFVASDVNANEVNHIDGNKLNNSFDNLEWVTRIENARHAVDMGLYLSGEKHPNSRYSNKERKQMVELRGERYSYTEIARQFNCHKSTARSICINFKESDDA